MGIAINYIDQSLVGYVPGTPEFLQLVSDTLGNVGDPSDGFDLALADLILSIPVTDAGMALMDQVESDLFGATDVLDSVDPTDLVIDFNESLPVMDAFNSSLQIQGVGSLQLPGLPPPPVGGAPLPPPSTTTCVPVPAPPPTTCLPVPAPPGTIPIPPPAPAPNPCPPGFVSSPTGCQPSPPPCPAGMSFTAGQCVEPVTPHGGGGVPPIVPPIITVPNDPCAQGFVSTAAGCVPQGDQSISLPPIIPIILGGGGVESTPPPLATILLGPTGAVLATTIPEVAIAFILFNSIFSGSFDAELAKWQAQILAYCTKDPLLCQITSLEQQLATMNQQLNSGVVPQGERATLQNAIAELTKQLTNDLVAFQAAHQH
jgi:hypothetical protein